MNKKFNNYLEKPASLTGATCNVEQRGT